MYKMSEFTKSFYKAGEVSKILGVTSQTLHNYDKDGIIKFERTEGGHRLVSHDELIRYLLDKGLIINDLEQEKKDVIYARVSSNEQKTKGDLDRQVVKILEGFNGEIRSPVILKEVGSGLNDKRRQLLKLINMVLNDEVSSIYITYKDRLTRFGYNYLETICNAKGVKIRVLSAEAENIDTQQEFANDLMSLIASFSGKLYGMRSHKKLNKDNKNLKED